MEVDVARMVESSSGCVNEPAASDAAGMDTFAAAEAGGAYAGMGTIAVHTEVDIVVLGQSYADGNILGMLAAISHLAEQVSRTYRAVCEVEASVSGYMAACQTDGGS